MWKLSLLLAGRLDAHYDVLRRQRSNYVLVSGQRLLFLMSSDASLNRYQDPSKNWGFCRYTVHSLVAFGVHQLTGELL